MDSTTHKHLAKTTGIQLGGKILSTFIGLLATLQLLRLLGPEQLGWYTIATGYLQFIGIAGDFGLTLITSTMLSEPDFDKTKVFNTLFTWRLITAVILQGLAPLGFLLFSYKQPIPTAVLILTVSFFAVQLNQIFSGYFQAQLKNHISVIGEVISRFVLLGGIYAVKWHGGDYFLPAMGVITIASVINTAYLAIRHGWFKLEIDRVITKVAFRKTWPTALAVIFNAFYLQGDKIILPLFESSEYRIGLYGASYRVIDIITQIAALLMATLLPVISFHWSRNLRAEFEHYVQLSLEVMAILLLPMVAGLVVLGTPIMQFIGKDYTAAGPILSWLSLAIVGIWLGLTFGHIMLALNRQKQAVYVFAGVALVSVIGYFAWIPRFGIWGAVGVSIMSEMAAGLCLAFLATTYGKFTPRFSILFKIFLSAATMGGFVFRLPITYLPFRILSGVGIYSGLLLCFGVISPKIIRGFIKTFKKEIPEIAR